MMMGPDEIRILLLSLGLMKQLLSILVMLVLVVWGQ